jgi:hypothetical protein
MSIASGAFGLQSLKAEDFKANRAMFAGPELSQYRYIHIATHGLLDSERPGLSALVLSLVDEQGKPQDGFLFPLPHFPVWLIFNRKMGERKIEEVFVYKLPGNLHLYFRKEFPPCRNEGEFLRS